LKVIYTKMKNFLLTTIVLMAAVSAMAQEKEALKPGFVHSVGLGVGYEVYNRREEVNLVAELGFGYRVNAKNTFAIGIRADVISGSASTFLLHTYDFLTTDSSPFLSYKIGAADVLYDNPGWHLGIEGGYRFLLAHKHPLRVGLSVESRFSTVSVGILARMDF